MTLQDEVLKELVREKILVEIFTFDLANGSARAPRKGIITGFDRYIVLIDDLMIYKSAITAIKVADPYAFDRVRRRISREAQNKGVRRNGNRNPKTR